MDYNESLFHAIHQRLDLFVSVTCFREYFCRYT